MPGLFEIQLVTDDHEAMVGFYRDVIGLQVIVESAGRGRVHLRVGQGQLILARAGAEQVLPEWPGVPPRMYGADEPTIPGPGRHGAIHYAFHVNDGQWAGIRARLEDCEQVACRGPITWGAGFESLYFRDPDGNVAELIRGVD